MNQTYDSVWDALSDSPEESENLKLRSELMIQITQHVQRLNLAPKEVRLLLGLTQPRVSYLMHGRIDKFSLDMLVSIATRAGLLVGLKVKVATAA